MRALLAAILLATTVLVTSCSSSTTSETAEQVKDARQGIDLLPGVASFLDERDEFGDPYEVDEMPDWAQGERQRVTFDSGRSLLFYLEDGTVVSVYEDDREQGRVLVWGEYSELEASEPVERSEQNELPAYTVLFQTNKYDGSGRFGDVLIPSVSRETSAAERETLARQIASKESLDDVTLYSTEEAYEANMSLSYEEAHPKALSEGLLGMLQDGVFTPGEDFYP